MPGPTQGLDRLRCVRVGAHVLGRRGHRVDAVALADKGEPATRCRPQELGEVAVRAAERLDHRQQDCFLENLADELLSVVALERPRHRRGVEERPVQIEQSLADRHTMPVRVSPWRLAPNRRRVAPNRRRGDGARDVQAACG
jgi:hypothetical protein